MKKTKVVALLLVCVCSLFSLTACGDLNYHKKVNEYKIWSNDISQAIAQPSVGKRVRDFLKADLPSGKKTKKVAFIGYDGCRADMMLNLDKTSKNSAIKFLVENGGKMYLSYAGGNQGINKQCTSTGPGWSALTSGVWGDKNGVTDNKMAKSIDYKTFMLESAIGEGYPKQYSSTFSASWSEHFWIAYSKEIDFLREKAGMEKQEPKDNDALKAYLDEIGKNAKDVVPMNFKFVKDDNELLNYLIDCVTVGNENEKDVIFGIFEGTDHAGHTYGFSNKVPEYVAGFKDEEAKARLLLQAIYSRPTFDEEDWLIIITTDHGGIKTGHGGQTMEERTTWLVCNQGMDAKYYSKNYDGKRAK